MKESDRNELRNEINNLINNDLDTDLPSVDLNPVLPFDSDKVSKEALSKAQKIVLSCLKLYFNENIIEKNEFMQAKANITTSNISTLFRQIKIAEFFIDKIVSDIDGGNLNPRIFEVASGIQTNIVDMLKNMQMHVISMQEEYKRLQSEMPKSELNPRVINILEDKGNKIYTNAKALLKDLEEE
jgi:hypothetical protein